MKSVIIQPKVTMTAAEFSELMRDVREKDGWVRRWWRVGGNKRRRTLTRKDLQKTSKKRNRI